MTRQVRLLLGLLLATCAAVVVHARDARADDYETAILDRRPGTSMEYRVRARMLATPAGSRVGGYGYVRCELVNPSDKAHTVVIELEPGNYYGSGRSVYRKSHRLEPKSTVSFDMPLLNVRWGVAAQFWLDGRRSPDRLHLGSRSRSYGSSLSVLLVSAGDEPSQWNANITTLAKRIGVRRAVVDAWARTAAQLPDSWTYLSGFDLIVVDHRTAGLTPERQQVLARYVAAGGNLIVHSVPETAATGPLAQMAKGRRSTATGSERKGRHGFGRWLVYRDPVRADSPAVHEWLNESFIGVSSVVERARHTHAGGTPAAMWLPLRIPGLGEVPVGMFFFLIAAFVILVGPVSYIYFRRKKKLAMLLLTIPLAGFLCTAFILGYGLFSEGFGIVGSARSFSVLDQEAQVAAVAGGRTLYAGLQPGSLTPSADSVVTGSSFATAGERASSLRVDLDAGHRIGGSLLPSRTPTPLVTTSVGRSRERLRFRRRDDGGFDVLAAPGFEPVPATGAVLFRSKEDGVYVSTSAGSLVPIESVSGELKDQLISALTAINAMPIGSGDVLTSDYFYGSRLSYRGRQAMQSLAASNMPLDAWVAAQVEGIPRNGYLARVRRPPLQEDLGLDVTYRSEEHVVLGLLGPEDVIDE